MVMPTYANISTRLNDSWWHSKTASAFGAFELLAGVLNVLKYNKLDCWSVVSEHVYRRHAIKGDDIGYE